MTPKPADEEMEERLLEIALERELAGKRQDLAPLVRAALDAERVGDEGEDMNALTMDFQSDVGGLPARWAGLNKNLLVNAAAVFLVVALGGLAMKTAGLFRGQGSEQDASILPDTEDEKEGTDQPTIVVHDLAEVRALPEGRLAVECSGENFDDGALIELCSSQPALRELKIWDSLVTEKGLQGLKSLPALRHLALPNNNYIGQDGWFLVTELKQLSSLDVSSFVGQTMSTGGLEPEPLRPPEGVRANSAVLRRIAEMKNLSELRIQGVSCDDEDLSALANGLHQIIEVLDISITRVSLDGLEVLGRFPRLRELNIVGVSQDVGNPLEHLQGLNALESLNIGSAGMSFWPIGSETLKPLISLPKLKHLDIQSSRLGENALDALASLPSLNSLRIASSQGLNSLCCSALTRIPGLEKLALVACNPFSDAMLESLADSKAIEVDLRWSTKDLSDQALASFCSARSGRVLSTAEKGPFEGVLQSYLIESGDYLSRFQAPGK